MVAVPIYHHTDSTRAKDDQGLKWDYSECGVREITFVQISGISTVKENGKLYGCIFSNGSEFVSTMSYDDLIELFKKNCIFEKKISHEN